MSICLLNEVMQFELLLIALNYFKSKWLREILEIWCLSFSVLKWSSTEWEVLNMF